MAMFDLRRWLEQANEDLLRSLEQSWGVAEATWLPALGTKRGSHNSVPHLRNLESYLNRLCQAFCVTGCEGQSSQIGLSPVEAYIILAAILFHDLGRTVDDKGHGSHSRDILRDRWGELRVPSKDIAGLVGRVCEYHEPSKKTRKTLAAELTITSIAPYGRVRLRELAALLRLVDTMDGAFTRVIPAYLQALKPNEAPGVFRSLVQDVQVDAASQTIYAVLGDGIREKKYSSAKSEDYYYKRSDRLPIGRGRLAETGTGRKYNYSLRGAISDYNIGSRLSEAFEKRASSDWLPALVDHADHDGPGTPFAPVEWLLAAGLVHFDDSEKNPEGWNRRMLLAALMADLRQSYDGLREERACLSRLGVNVRGWLLEYEEHLYDEAGTETIEPILYRDYLKEVARRMWELSTGVFGQAECTYEELASATRETDMNRTRLAVRRLSILTELIGTSVGKGVGIWAGPDRWRWLMRREQASRGRERCFYVTYRDVERRIDEINEPRAGDCF
jgi:hypothetical protein